MDSNGLADPYVKLHLLPGASKVMEFTFLTFYLGVNICLCIYYGMCHDSEKSENDVYDAMIHAH